MTLTHDLAIVEAYATRALPTISATATRRKRAIGHLCQILAVDAQAMRALPAILEQANADDDGSPLRSSAGGARGSEVSNPTLAAVLHPSTLAVGVQRCTEAVHVCALSFLAAVDAHKAGDADGTLKALQKAHNAAADAIGHSDRLRRHHARTEPHRAAVVATCVACGDMALPRPRRGYCWACYEDWRHRVGEMQEDQGRWERTRAKVSA